MKALDKPYIEFICNPYECKLGSSVNTRIKIDIMEKDICSDDLLETFELFMKAIGYSLKDNQQLEIVTTEIIED